MPAPELFLVAFLVDYQVVEKANFGFYFVDLQHKLSQSACLRQLQNYLLADDQELSDEGA